MNKLFNNPRAAVVIILVLIVLFFAYKANATEAEIGATYASKFNSGVAIVMTERFLDNKMDVGVALIGEQDYDKENIVVGNNGNIFVAFVASKPASWWIVLPAEAHIGMAYWIETNRFIGDELGYQLALKWHFGKHATLGIRHWSNAGTVKPNRGQDLLTLGWRF
jgi:hypothetical protein